MRLKERILKHLRANLGLYLVLTGIYVAGVVFGSLGVGALQPEHQTELAGFLQRSFAELADTTPQIGIIDLIWENLKIVLVAYVLGMTVIGMPIIFVLIFTRGFVLGFAVGFLVQARGLQGIAVALMSVLPPSLLNIPVLIVTSVCAITFSLSLVRGSAGLQGNTLTRQFAAYSGSVLLMLFIASLAALLQGYLSPLMLKVILAYSAGI
ncbi:MAG TPA: stage II sporulation protein M [Verrucomicrobiae bacterium]|nr:stage II sporulation protein M [Verrucomicrobiae bacterium]